MARELQIRITGESSHFRQEAAQVVRSEDEMAAHAQKLGATLMAAGQAGEAGMQRIARAVGGTAVDLERINDLQRQFGGGAALKSAEEYALAIESVGGATKLTAANQAEANAVFMEAIEQYQKLGQEVPEHLTALAAATKPPAEETKNLTTRVKEMFLGYLAGIATWETVMAVGRKLIGFLKDSIAEAIEADKVQRRLTAALEQQGTAIPEVVDHFDRLVRKYQDLTVHSDEALKETQALLVQVGGVLPSEMDKALEAVTNLSAGLGTDLNSAAMLVSKSFEDNFTALGRAGVQIDTTRAKAEGMDYVLGQINAKFGGQARSEMQSYEGQIRDLGNAWDDFKEKIGNVMVESGALQVAIVILRVALNDLQSKLTYAIAVFNTMPSLTDVASKGMIAVGEWAGKAAQEHRRLATEAAMVSSELGDLRQPLSSHAKTLTEAEQAVRRAREEEAKRAKALAEQTERQKEALEAAKQYRAEIQNLADQLTGRALAAEVRKVADAVRVAGGAMGLSVFETHRLADALEDMREQGAKLPPTLEAVIDRSIDLRAAQFAANQVLIATPPLLKAIGTDAMLASGRVSIYRDELTKLAKAGIDLSKTPGFMSGADVEAALGGAVPEKIKVTVGDAVRGGLMNAAADFPDMLTRAILHGQSFEDAFRATLVKSFSGTFAEFGKGLAKEGSRLSGFLGDVFGAAGGILGDLIGKGISALINSFKGEGAKANDLRDALKEAIGGDAAGKGLEKMVFESMNAAGLGSRLADELNDAFIRFGSGSTAVVQRAGDDIVRILNEIEQAEMQIQEGFNDLLGAAEAFGGRAPRSLQPLVREMLTLNGLTEEQKLLLGDLVAPAQWEEVEDVLESLGSSSQRLGENLEKAKQVDFALDLAHKLEFLEDAGADVDGVLFDIREKLSGLVNDAIASGITLPESLRPYINRALELGLLLGPNGEIRTGIEGVSFAEIPDEPLLLLKGILEEIRDLLQNGLPTAARNTGKALEDELNRDFTPRVRWPGGFGSSDESAGQAAQPPVPMARGGIVTRPTVILAGEAGPEAIVPLSSRGMGGDNKEIVRLLVSIERRLANQETTMPRQIADAFLTRGSGRR